MTRGQKWFWGVAATLVVLGVIGSQEPRNQNQTADVPNASGARSKCDPSDTDHAQNPNPLLSVETEELLRKGQVLADRMRTQNRLPRKGIVSVGGPLITKQEVDNVCDALSEIPASSAQSARALQLLALLQRRTDEGKRAAQTYLTEQLKLDAAADRKDYAAAVERLFLEDGMDVHVRASGPESTTLTIQYVLINRPWVYKVLNDTDFIANRKKEGFRRAVFTDGYDHSWVYDLTK